MPKITSSRRVKRTPFSEGVEAANVNAYTVYNHMLLATEFESVIEDYHHLKQHVQLWDVACEKVLRVYGDEAEKLNQQIEQTIKKKFQLVRVADGRLGQAPALAKLKF